MTAKTDTHELPSRYDVEVLLAERMHTDEGFRKKLEIDPHQEIGKLIGIDIPEFITINFHDESDTEIHLVIPRGSHLNLSELDAIAGGTGGACCSVISGIPCMHKRGTGAQATDSNY